MRRLSLLLLGVALCLTGGAARAQPAWWQPFEFRIGLAAHDVRPVSAGMEPGAALNGEIYLQPFFKTGDGLLAFFGAPLGREDDPVRAVRCGLGLIRAAQNYASEVQSRWNVSGFNVGVGINTGLVALGEVGGASGSEYTAMGDAINLASRVESNAPVGNVLISRDTYIHVRGIFEIRKLDPIKVKGKSTPLEVCGVRAARSESSIRLHEPSSNLPLVGRSRELEAARATITGRVIDIRHQVPIGNVEVVFRGAAGDASTTARPDGQYAPTELDARSAAGEAAEKLQQAEHRRAEIARATAWLIASAGELAGDRRAIVLAGSPSFTFSDRLSPMERST